MEDYMQLQVEVESDQDGVMCLAHDTIVDEGVTREVVYSGGFDGTIKRWNMKGEEEKKLAGHSDCVNCMIVNKSRGVLFSCSDDKVIIVRELGGENAVMERVKGHTSGISSMTLANDRYLFTCDDEGEIRVWDVDQKQDWMILAFNAGIEALNCLAFTNSLLWSGGDDGFLRSWQIPLEKKDATTQLIPTNNVEVLEIQEAVSINAMTVQDGLLWCGIGSAALSVIQARSPIEGILVLCLKTSDWCRSIRFAEGKALTAHDDGFLYAWDHEPAVDYTTDAAARDRVALTPIVRDPPSDAVMDLAAFGNHIISTRDAQLRFWQCAAQTPAQ